MKCQHCDKTATFHITELMGGKPQELHLCEEHARQYLTQSEAEPAEAPSLADAMKSKMALGHAAEELAQLDQQTCPVCGIAFFEFRNQGRLGCSHDYVCFEKQLEPLILNIHGSGQHTGKRPQRYAEGTQQHTELIRLRREMKEAVTLEDYERAKDLRDRIRKIEETRANP